MTGRRLGLGPALLFCPADRPDRYGKALQRADAVILDLEDGVDPANRPEARRALAAFTPDEADLGRVIVRVNAASSPDFAADLDALRGASFRTIMLAKAEAADQVAAIAGALEDVRVIALCETAAGVLSAAAIARHPAVVALMWGAEDLIVSLGGTSSRDTDGGYRQVARHARSTVLLEAAVAGVEAIDAVHIDLEDLDGLAGEAEDAAATGFAATACLHPRQVDVVRAAYRPSEAAVARAREILAAAGARSGAFRLDSAMVDEPLIAQARVVLRRAQAAADGKDDSPTMTPSSCSRNRPADCSSFWLSSNSRARER